MRNQRLQIDQPSRNQANRLWIYIMVPILELEIDLFGGHVHKWDILEVPADTDDENSASESSRLDHGITHQRLYPKDG